MLEEGFLYLVIVRCVLVGNLSESPQIPALELEGMSIPWKLSNPCRLSLPAMTVSGSALGSVAEISGLMLLPSPNRA